MFAALGFLTVLPLPAKWTGDSEDLTRSLPWFPAVGILIGAVIALLDRGFTSILPPLPAAVLTAAALTAASGALHLDGLADTADGFFSSRPAERMLEIMKDSRIGSMGVAAIVVVYALKVSLLASLSGPARSGVVFMMPVAGRFAPVLMIATMKYVREGGLGTVFSGNRNPFIPLLSLGVMAAAGWLCMGIAGVASAVVTAGGVGVFSWWCVRKIRGYTGDTLGAAVELCEAIPPLVFLAAARMAGMP